MASALLALVFVSSSILLANDLFGLGPLPQLEIMRLLAWRY